MRAAIGLPSLPLPLPFPLLSPLLSSPLTYIHTVYKVKCWLDMKGEDIKKDQKFIITEPPNKANVPIHEEAKKSFMFARGMVLI